MISKRKQKIKELEAELLILDNVLYVRHENGSDLHARHNKILSRYFEILRELERISLKWKMRKFLRRFK